MMRYHPCGTPCDNHTNCANDGCHLLFIQCESCKDKTDNCCSAECQEVIHLPLVEQVKLRKGMQMGNKIFRKGKSPALKFKSSGQLPNLPLAKAEKQKTKIIKSSVKKVIVGQGQHYYPKSEIGMFLMENETIKTGDTLLFYGP